MPWEDPPVPFTTNPHSCSLGLAPSSTAPIVLWGSAGYYREQPGPGSGKATLNSSVQCLVHALDANSTAWAAEEVTRLLGNPNQAPRERLCQQRFAIQARGPTSV